VDQEGRPAVEHGSQADRERAGQDDREHARKEVETAMGQRLVVIGEIARPHGLHGEMRVTP